MISGATIDNSNVYHGFVRARNGTITVFDVPGAGTGPFQGTDVAGINPAGVTEGSYVDSSGVGHGFVRSPSGAITTFDVPGAGTGSGQGTFPANINPAGAITGTYIDASNVFTASCGMSTAPSRHLTLQARARVLPGHRTILQQPGRGDHGILHDASNVYHGFLVVGE